MQNIKKHVLEKYFSKARLEKYQKFSDQNIDFIELYQLNMKCSEKFFTALIQFEVLLRNSINQQLVENFGEKWFDCELLNFSDKQRDMIQEVKLKLSSDKKESNSCNITSNLNFGFWTSLFSPNCEKILWRKSLYKIFYNVASKPSRGRVRERLEKFRTLRNRISHCECIIHFPLKKYFSQLVEMLNWINSDIAKWLDEEINFSSINFEKTKHALRPK